MWLGVRNREKLGHYASHVFHASSYQLPRSRAWVFLLMGDEQADPAFTAIASLHVHQTRYKVVALTWKVSLQIQQQLSSLGVQQYPVDPISCPHVVSRNDSLHKYMQFACSKVPNLFSLTAFREIVYLDTDILLLENIDYVFDELQAHKSISMVSNPRSAEDYDHTSGLPVNENLGFNGGFMLLRPNRGVQLAFLTFLESQRRENLPPNARADQKLTVEFFRSSIQPLPVVLNWAPWNMCLHGSGLYEYALQHRPKVIHFSGKFKLWAPADDGLDGFSAFSATPCGVLGEEWAFEWRRIFTLVKTILESCTEECSLPLRGAPKLYY